MLFRSGENARESSQQRERRKMTIELRDGKSTGSGGGREIHVDSLRP